VSCGTINLGENFKMSAIKEQISEAISRAKADLDNALGTLEKIPSFDATSVAFAAHALNNFLTVTTAINDLLRLSLKNYPDEEVQEWLENLRRTTRMMTHIVAELMNDATMRNRPELVFEKFDLSKLVRRACAYYQRMADHKDITIKLALKLDHSSAWADRVAVSAVIDNLLSNAVKYSSHGKEIHVSINQEPETIKCSIQDSGPGLSTDDQAKLFQKGVTLRSVPTGNESSTGYGLAVAKELIDLLGGSIWCESQLGQGACFSFNLPVSASDK
jgi:signal transduction histidine kinase